VLKLETHNCYAYALLSPRVSGGVIMTQASSLRKLTLHLDTAHLTGDDFAVFVSSDAST